MLRIIQNQSSAGAKSYYSHSDYLSEGQELAGYWQGKGAERLGLSGIVEKKDFDALCDNLDPRTGQALTPRNRADRTIGMDFNFNVPKGLSLAYALGDDQRILPLVRQAVAETMAEVEKDTKTRVRKLGKQEDRNTGNLIVASFLHTTARPVNGVPDPNIHIHAFTFNATLDPVENIFKAVNFRDQKKSGEYYEAIFHSKLAKGAKKLGYEIERRGRFWDVAKVPASLRNKFSRRTDQIEELARKKGALSADEKGELGAKSREAKVKSMGWSELQADWCRRLSAEEAASIANGLTSKETPLALETTPTQAMSHAVEHSFERSAVVPERTLLASALRRGYGDVTLDQLPPEFDRHEILRRNLLGENLVTTRHVLAEEEAVLSYARKGRGKCEPLNASGYALQEWLSDEQKSAIRQLVESRDAVQILRGGAGTGKTTLMQQAVAAIEAGGRQVFTFAPSAEASRKVLRDEGFQKATTVAELLVNPKLQAEVEGNVIWIDEASLLGTKQLRQVFDLAEKKHARVILSGDYRQHGSVQRGGLLRVLEVYAGLRPAQIHSIRRQTGEYKQAVAALADGRFEEGFQRLDALGWIREIPNREQRDATIARDFAAALREPGAKRDKALVIAPTHQEASHLTQAIRKELTKSGLLAADSRKVSQLIPRHLTDAERADQASYEPGDVVVFQQNARGHRKGERIVVGESLPRDLLGLADRFAVFRPATLDIAVGEQLRFTAGGTTVDSKHRINNGMVARVSGFGTNGDIMLDNGWRVGHDFGHLTHGYVQTSVSSQGRTVDLVFIAESRESFGAANRQQWYVSVSRAKKEARVYSDSKEDLRTVVERSADPLTAVEFLTSRQRLRERVRRLMARTKSLEHKQPSPVKEIVHAK